MKINPISMAFAFLFAFCAFTLPAKAAGVFYAFGVGVSFKQDSASNPAESYFNLVDTVYAPSDVPGTALISSTLSSSLVTSLNPEDGGYLRLTDAAGKTYTNGNDTANAMTLFWRVYEKGTVGGSFNEFFTTQTSTWLANGDTNKYFRGTATPGSINLTSGLTLGNITAPKTYVLEFFGRADFSWAATDGNGDPISGTFSDWKSNGGGNYATEFQLIPEPSSASLMGLATAGLLALRRRHSA